MKVQWTRRAEANAAETAEFIARDKPDAALQWLALVHEAADALRRHPRRGRVVPELVNPAYRELLVRRYRLVCRLLPARVVIVAVSHARRAWPVASNAGDKDP